jgi:glycosyltransferase involved in cell wall biosynthesis
MHICFVCSHLYPCSYGGVEFRYYLLAKELVKKGHRISYITYSCGKSDLAMDIISLGKTPRHYDKSGRRRLLPIIFFGLKAAYTVRKISCDVIDISVPYTPALLLPKGSFLLTLLEFWDQGWKRYYGSILGGLTERGEKWLINRPKAIITISEFVAKKIKNHTNVPVYTVPIGLSLQEYSKYAINTQRDIDIITIGRLVPIKGWSNFVELLKLINKPLKVLIVGDGPLYQSLSRQLSNTIHRIEIRRRISENKKLALLSQAKYFLNLSQFEGFSISTLEALACGAYPIILDTGYNAAIELVQNSGCGAIIKNVREAAELVTTDPPICKPNLLQYTLDAFVKRYLEVVEAVVD